MKERPRVTTSLNRQSPSTSPGLDSHLSRLDEIEQSINSIVKQIHSEGGGDTIPENLHKLGDLYEQYVSEVITPD